MFRCAFAKISESEHNILAVCKTIRDEFFPLVYNKCCVDLHVAPWYRFLPIDVKGLAFTYLSSGKAPLVASFFKDLGSDTKHLAKIKVIQKLHGSQTIHHSSVWTHPLKEASGKR